MNRYDDIIEVRKFNPFHDAKGRFSSSNGMKSYSANPKSKAGQMAIQRSTAAGYGGVMNVHRESKGENIRQNDNWIKSGQKPTKSQLARAAANAPTSVSQMRQNAHTNRVKGTMGATETATARHPQKTTQKPQKQTQQQNQNKPQKQTQQQNQQTTPTGKTSRVKQKMKSGITMDVDFDQGTVSGAKNKEFKGTAHGKDITKKFDATKMSASDSYLGADRFTDKAADMQGFNAPAKKVSKAEFAKLAAACGDEFYRTVEDAIIDGKHLSAKQFKEEYTNNSDLKLNGTGARYYGDGLYVASAKMIAGRGKKYTQSDARTAMKDSQWYGDGRTTLKMTWVSKPKIITQSQLDSEWNKLSKAEKAKYGGHSNTYAVLKGYDALYSRRQGYMVVFNRSKIAVCED